MTLEGDPKNTGQTEETVKIPQIIELRRIMFDEKSLGFSLFPGALEGRKRAEATFLQPFKSLFGNKSTSDLRTLEARNISTVADVLALEDEQLEGLKNRDTIKKRLSEYLQGLVQTPHGKLMERVFGKGQRKDIPLEREQELIDAVNKALNTLPERRKLILQLRFGLVDGITRSRQEIAVSKNPPVSQNAIGESQTKAEMKLRSRRYSIEKELKQYLALPENSFAREVFGSNIVFQKDLPQLSPITLRDVPVKTQIELENSGVFNFYSTINNIVIADLDSTPLSSLSIEAREEIKKALKKQEELLKVQETDRMNMGKVREIISRANAEGFTSVTQILEWANRQNIRVLNNNPHSFVSRAIIEHVLKSNPTS